MFKRVSDGFIERYRQLFEVSIVTLSELREKPAFKLKLGNR
jgi:hypothetical protein